MADANTTASTGVPEKTGVFPPFDYTTYPSQIFWLVVTFAFLFVVLWRVAGPRINGVITSRRGAINAEIAKAKADADAEASGAMAKAQARIAATRDAARGHVLKAAEEAAIAIVARLTGETVSAADAAAAVRDS